MTPEKKKDEASLSAMLDRLDRENAYTVVEILREKSGVLIEKVQKDGRLYLRKQYQKDLKGANEFELLSHLKHPGLPVIHEVFELTDRLVFVEEFIEGDSLARCIQQRFPIKLETCIDLILQLLYVVEYLHVQLPPVIHRDIKPDNIILTPNGTLKLIDFDIARTFSPQKGRDTVSLGTIGYAPPEQYGFGQTDTRSDIYSIGMTFLFLLTGCEPDPNHVPWNRLPPGLARIIRISTEFAPKARYQSVRQMIWDLENEKREHSAAPLVCGEAGQADALARVQKRKRVRLQLLLLPLHFIALVTTVDFLFIEPFHLTPGFGLQDAVVSVLEYVSLPVVVIFPLYLIGLNMFYITDRIPVLQTKKAQKVLLLFVLLVLIELILIRFLNLFHTAEFLNAVSP